MQESCLYIYGWKDSSYAENHKNTGLICHLTISRYLPATTSLDIEKVEGIGIKFDIQLRMAST